MGGNLKTFHGWKLKKIHGWKLINISWVEIKNIKWVEIKNISWVEINKHIRSLNWCIYSGVEIKIISGRLGGKNLQDLNEKIVFHG